ncbi:murein hydrolase activator EnvC family protein [Yunchengibacter salinarum]|uniref:murein hydrolase activator EnvC family protein n=1 Tax=Yunchengibacter salinarum TaxID=3133399 RepID=UPI0035B65179
MVMRAILLILLSAAWLSGPLGDARAQDADDSDEARAQLEALEQEMDARAKRRETLGQTAEEARAAAESLSQRLVTLGRDIRLKEADATRLEQKINDLQAAQRARRSALDERRGELAALLGALERLGNRPPELSLLQPGKAVETARSASVMGTLVPMIRERSDQLRQDLEMLAELRADVANRQRALNRTLDNLKARRADMDRLIAQRKQEAQSAETGAAREAAALDRLASRADDLKALIGKLEERERRRREILRRQGSAPPKGASFSEARGRMPFPATGKVVSRFGDDAPVGKLKGIRLETRPGGTVVAPFEGRVVFAGPYRGYGHLLIIDHGQGYHSLLAGMGQVAVSLGQRVLTAEPVGAMPAKSDRPARLYLELRQGGDPVDPAPWLSRQTAEGASTGGTGS